MPLLLVQGTVRAWCVSVLRCADASPWAWVCACGLLRVVVTCSQVGYCQGMGFITAMFLSYLAEEDAFFLLLSIMNFPPHSLTGLYSPGLPKVKVLEHQLLVRSCSVPLGCSFPFLLCDCSSGCAVDT